MEDFEFQLYSFMLYCSSKNIARKTLVVTKLTIKLFGKHLQDQYQIEYVKKVQS